MSNIKKYYLQIKLENIFFQIALEINKDIKCIKKETAKIYKKTWKIYKKWQEKSKKMNRFDYCSLYFNLLKFYSKYNEVPIYPDTSYKNRFNSRQKVKENDCFILEIHNFCYTKWEDYNIPNRFLKCNRSFTNKNKIEWFHDNYIKLDESKSFALSYECTIKNNSIYRKPWYWTCMLCDECYKYYDYKYKINSKKSLNNYFNRIKETLELIGLYEFWLKNNNQRIDMDSGEKLKMERETALQYKWVMCTSLNCDLYKNLIKWKNRNYNPEHEWHMNSSYYRMLPSYFLKNFRFLKTLARNDEDKNNENQAKLNGPDFIFKDQITGETVGIEIVSFQYNVLRIRKEKTSKTDEEIDYIISPNKNKKKKDKYEWLLLEYTEEQLIEELKKMIKDKSRKKYIECDKYYLFVVTSNLLLTWQQCIYKIILDKYKNNELKNDPQTKVDFEEIFIL